MTTAAKLKPNPSEGHGLTARVTDAIYHARQKGKPEGEAQIVCVTILKPVGHSEHDTANGRHQQVSFEVVKIEPVTDAGESDQLRWLLDKLYEKRTSTGQQRSLSLGFAGLEVEERRQEVMEAMEAWHDARVQASDTPVKSLDAEWREYWAMGPDDEWSWGDQGTPGDYRKASIQHLLTFAHAVGALAEDAEAGATNGLEATAEAEAAEEPVIPARDPEGGPDGGWDAATPEFVPEPAG